MTDLVVISAPTEKGDREMDEERTFYCEEAERNCPFVSRFRYCSCCELRLGVDDPKEKLVDVLRRKPYGQCTYEEMADYLFANGVAVHEPDGCGYCRGASRTEEPFTVITRKGRKVNVVFNFCPRCGRQLPKGE